MKKVFVLYLLLYGFAGITQDSPSIERRQAEIEIDSIKTQKGWFKQALLSSPMLYIDSGDYQFVATLLWDVQLGREAGRQSMRNTRGALVQGRFFKKLNFASSIYENQVIAPDYVSDYVNQTYIYPGGARIKPFKDRGFDFFYASSYINYEFNKYFNAELGYGKNFIGEGYRSLLLSDNAFNYPYLKLETKFWRITYSNLYAELQDISNTGNADQIFDKKYFATHMLDFKVADWLNIAAFETVTWAKDTSYKRSVEYQYLNPVIFYRPVEFGIGSPDNVMLGLNIRSELKNGITFYGQIILDEFLLSELRDNNGWWANKYGGQLGAKWENTFGVENLNIRAEVNAVRPFTYTHFNHLNAYGHFNQALAHPLQANFQEVILQASYAYKGFYIDAKINRSLYGADSSGGTFTYGGDIFRTYNDRAQIYGNSTGQGIAQNRRFYDVKLGYEINPVTKMRVELSILRREFEVNDELSVNNWISLGFKTMIGNTYYDFL